MNDAMLNVIIPYLYEFTYLERLKIDQLEEKKENTLKYILNSFLSLSTGIICHLILSGLCWAT